MAAKALSGDIGELKLARTIRLEADRNAPMSERLARVHALFKQTVDERPFDPATDAGVIRRGGNVTAMTRFGGLDVVQRAQGVPSYSQLAADAVRSELLGVPVMVCSLARLREMKRAQSRTQDLLDLENLPES
jgi:hypothetical protein